MCVFVSCLQRPGGARQRESNKNKVTAATAAAVPVPTATSVLHTRQPPLLEGDPLVLMSTWPDGNGVAPAHATHGCVSDAEWSDEHLELFASATRAELPAVMASLRATRHAPDRHAPY